MARTIDIGAGDEVRVKIPTIYVRSNESKAIRQTLVENGTAVDLRNWSIELYVQDEDGLYGSALKTITEGSSAAAVGQINDAVNGGYFFTLLAADIAALLGSTVTSSTREAYVRYVGDDTSPPRTISIVEFLVEILPSA